MTHEQAIAWLEERGLRVRLHGTMIACMSCETGSADELGVSFHAVPVAVARDLIAQAGHA